ncbi:MAG: PepSY domain-containing protein [bacterium]|nr:PepSY domain-containing protein [bacterium]
MKYIFGLSLSGICLVMFVFAIQGNAISADVDFGSLLNRQTGADATTAKVEMAPVAEVVESKTVVTEPATERQVTAAEKAMTRNEAIKKAVRGRSWEEAKPDVIRVLNDYSGKKADLRQNRPPVEHPQSRDREAKDMAREGITEDEAVAIALKNTPGEMIGVKKKKGNYRVKVWSETDGASYKIYIDPQSGKILSRKRD